MKNSVAATTPIPQGLIDNAFRLGCIDGRDGRPCLPELYFVRRAQQIAYCHGHIAVCGKTLLSDQMMGRLVDNWTVTVTA